MARPSSRASRPWLRALELGVNYIDTAPTYFDSEEVLGKALEGVETPFYLSTKIGGRLTPFPAAGSYLLAALRWRKA